ncbi:DsbA family protein [Streptomyces sp. Wh19]|uniref:DsbA family protein n=1 Tax=Streptomyces sp. Wh19 TaxID=3076629 RepID=UPI002958689D|nr:DsbA family protein [Streptomyces sp. Wh19]MDV9194757.1 DsbA family protein [Streptomyces sp. Wh19]
MRVEVWADVVCPWAYIGKRRLERALADSPESRAEVVWRPFRIDPMAPERAVPLSEELRDPVVDAALSQCAPGVSPAENRVRVSRIAEEEGIGPRWGAAWRADSHAAHRLLALALDSGGSLVQGAVAEGVMRAHFVEGRDISAHEVLADIARQAGFPQGGALLSEGAGDRTVRESLLSGKARGVKSSPTLVIAGRSLTGAQPAEVIGEFLRHSEGRKERNVPAEVERFRQAEALLDLGDPLGCLTLLAPLLEEQGEDRGVRLLAGRAYFRSAQLTRAETVLERLVAESPDDSYARLLLGRTLERQGRDAEAAVHLRVAAAMTPAYER